MRVPRLLCRFRCAAALVGKLNGWLAKRKKRREQRLRAEAIQEWNIRCGGGN